MGRYPITNEIREYKDLDKRITKDQYFETTLEQNEFATVLYIWYRPTIKTRKPELDYRTPAIIVDAMTVYREGAIPPDFPQNADYGVLRAVVKRLNSRYGFDLIYTPIPKEGDI
jgi:hypothetical protein